MGSALSVVGTDEVTETEAFKVKDGSYAVVLDEAIVPYSGTNVTVEAENTEGKELFLGTANGVDADSYLDGVAQEQISDVSFPNEVVHRFIPGDPKPETDIADRDWWISQDTGEKVTKTFDLDADPQVLVIAPANADDNLDGTTVALKMRVAGVFGLSLLGIALGVILAGFAVFFFLRWWSGRIRPRKKDAYHGDEKSPEPPRRRDGRKARSMRIATVATLGSGLALSGCSALPVAQPHTPENTPYERTAMRPGEAGKFMTGYTESLDKILGDGGTDLDKIQGAPLIDRTRAQIQIADKAKQKLRAPDFTEVVAGSPSFEAYPMWFYAFGPAAEDSTEGDEQMTQVQLVTRESASAEPIVRSASYIPSDQMPTLMADGKGAVETAPESFDEELSTTADQVSSYLVDGKDEGKDAQGLGEGGFKGFRDYLGDLRDKDSGFDKVDVECKPYEDLDFATMALSTEHGAIGMGEVRCTLTIKVPDDYSLDLGDTVKVETAHPYVLLKTDDKLSAVATDWNVLTSRIE